MSTQARPELTPMPDRIKRLPVDPERGYPVPWFVAWLDGNPEFRAMDPDKFVRAVKEKLCWVCGDKMGANLCFPAGPMCGINRTSAEPPAHYECAKWSAINCPFLNNPQMTRREDDLMNNERFRAEAAGVALVRNPGVTMLWVCRSYEILPDPRNSKPLITMGEPSRVEWMKEGRPATRDEVLASIESGMPNLVAMAKSEGSFALDYLKRAEDNFQKWIPQ